MRTKILALLALMAVHPLFGSSCGKLDFGPAYLHVDNLINGNTVAQMDLYAWKMDGCATVWQGLALKPGFLIGKENGKGRMANASFAIGHYLPCGSAFTFFPNIGVTYSYLKTELAIHPFPMKLDETFRSISPFIGCDLTICFNACFRIYGFFQYAWSRSRTTIEQIGSSKGNSQGANYGLMLEQDISSSWSLNLGVGYNSSMDETKNGIRAYGAKFGAAWWF